MDLAEYAYRTQQSLKLKPYEDNTIIMNGHKIGIEKLMTFPLDDSKVMEKEEFFIQPPPFDKFDPITLEAGNVVLEFQVERKPYDSMNEIFIQLSYKELIVIDIILDEDTFQSKWTIHTTPKSNSANDLYRVLVFYNEFGKGNVKYQGERFAALVDKKGFSFVDKSNIELLRKVIQLENKLNIVFDIPTQFTNNDYAIVEQLYTSLILNKPFKRIVSFNELTCTGTPLEGKGIESILNKDILLTACNVKTIELFGNKFDLFMLQAFFHLLVIDVEICDENTTKLKIDDTNKKMFISYRYFIDEDAVIRYQRNKKWIDKFENAKTIE